MAPKLGYYPLSLGDMKRKSKLIPYISLIPFTDIIYMLSDWVVIGTAGVIIVGIGIASWQSKKDRKESRDYRGEVLRLLRWLPVPPSPTPETASTTSPTPMIK